MRDLIQKMQPQEQLKCGVVIVAAGRGERAGQSAEGPKQYRTIGDRPVIAHTLDTFATWPNAGPIVVVIHPDDEALFDAARKRSAAGDVIVVHGGATRQISVLAGLEALANTGVGHVMIHDAVRPFADHALLSRCAAALGGDVKAVLPAVAVADTLKRADMDGAVLETVAREGLYGAQTPQTFDLQAILAAHRDAARSGRTDFTDDASIAEWAGHKVVLVEGTVDNVKLTLRRDIAMADEKLKRTALPDVRTGNGYDVHQLVEGDGVTLCGVFIPHTKKLSGHSDADVALHALTDALLATCGAGDIGDHFPPSDPQWKGAPSRIFLEHAARIVRERGGIITNADVSLIAEAPKVGPHRQTMRENLADILEISLDRCSVKATTNERLGFVGRDEGIAAIATATVVYGNLS
ncbi:bifunctional 2-C-methyl-D-erythritol 4-phosphate cytidylyltransferase/2-C-methyl-D-erythritol 2,4-cyclodiphosphate synthase [Ensifer sp. LC13]|nr:MULTISPECIES: bifunctional 2-C-methyl-D-erythritol 4-phosphate cytidylyltransferase/2-C-methyl-D-erythritol 2,4-cyclodiphosphate synthase [unclassified Ensifer]OCP00884.1 bifunctional 2-C-methyl-D-erythritol 4-phosphate cytidylyltransferase/2-C-methyl-D-erythritol 2,4-cyclodiphosphate synthase [Ensifer sp. LC11]OCP01453.1 bifunctional 2-C-methyl-D-erythritol 4-phosphate cytidylyltransferase/2-C-methyl-D-erythritol 2,4-cyclodiphosphate synthase [Ensifer sp. LC13]OCP02001.1 bifunctional 2-C-met